MLDASLFATRYTNAEARGIFKNLNREGVLELATDRDSLPYHARAALLEELHVKFAEAGIPSASGFYQVLADHKAIVSGSFVPSFLEPDFVATWKTVGYEPGDVDLYVGKGRLEDTITSLFDLNGGNLQIISQSTAPNPTVDENGVFHFGERNSTIYNNAAVHAMAKLAFHGDNGRTCYIDVMESKSKSAVFSIAPFHLTHLRAGFTSEGFFDLHPGWRANHRTYCTKTQHAMPNDVALEPFLPSFDPWIYKYKQRGYDVKEDRCVTDLEEHECTVSQDCPLTLRNSCDQGVRLVPFTEEAAVKMRSGGPAMFGDPIVYWKHGGRCVHSGKVSEKELLYDSDGVDNNVRVLTDIDF